MLFRYKIVDRKGFGKRLVTRRNSLGLTLRDIENETDLSNETLWNLERGKREELFADHIRDLSAGYQLNQEYIIDLITGKKGGSKNERS